MPSWLQTRIGPMRKLFPSHTSALIAAELESINRGHSYEVAAEYSHAAPAFFKGEMIGWEAWAVLYINPLTRSLIRDYR